MRPQVPMDLSLAPVAAAIDRNLQRLRDKESAGEIDRELQLELDQPPLEDTREERRARVLALALRNIDLHGWEVDLAADDSRLHLSGGSVSLDLGLSAAILAYLADGHD